MILFIGIKNRRKIEDVQVLDFGSIGGRYHLNLATVLTNPDRQDQAEKGFQLLTHTL